MRANAYLVRTLLCLYTCGDVSLCIGSNRGINERSTTELKSCGKPGGGRWNTFGVRVNPNSESTVKYGPEHRRGVVGFWRKAVVTPCRNFVTWVGGRKRGGGEETHERNGIVGQHRDSKAYPRRGGVSALDKRQEKKVHNVMSWRGGSKYSLPNGILAANSNGWGSGISLELFKVALSLFLTALNVSCWLLPMRLKHFHENSKMLGLANAFSGGVFLSLAFGEMIPHAHEDLAKSGYPLLVSLYLALSGYLLIFFVEKIMFNTHELMHSDESNNFTPTTVQNDAASLNGGRDKGGGSGRSGFVLLIALGIHSIFETMALGLCDTKVNAALMTMSIAIHQPAESLALLVTLLNNGIPTATIFRALSLFSCVGPLGMFLGIAVSEHSGPLVTGTVVALAAGTFIYVGATEMIAEEFDKNEDTWKKFGALVLGVISIAFITNCGGTIECFT